MLTDTEENGIKFTINELVRMSDMISAMTEYVARNLSRHAEGINVLSEFGIIKKSMTDCIALLGKIA